MCNPFDNPDHYLKGSLYLITSRSSRSRWSWNSDLHNSFDNSLQLSSLAPLTQILRMASTPQIPKPAPNINHITNAWIGSSLTTFLILAIQISSPRF